MSRARTRFARIGSVASHSLSRDCASATGWCWNTAGVGGVPHPPVGLGPPLQRECEATEPILAKRVRARDIYYEVRLKHRESRRQSVAEPGSIFLVARAVREVDVEVRERLDARIIVKLVDREREYRIIGGENGGGSIAVMHVAIHHHGPPDRLIALQPPDCHGDVVDCAEALAMVREGMVESAARVERHAIRKRQAGGEYAPSGRQPERLDHPA